MLRENFGLILLSLILVGLLGAAAVHKDALRARIDEALSQGKDFSFETELADHLGFDRSLAAKVLEVPPEKAKDRKFHSFDVILHEGRPFRVVLWTAARDKKGMTSEAFAAETDGRIRRAIMERRVFDASGRLEPGAIADLKVHSSVVTAAYRRELDFWLDGAVRKGSP